MMAVQWAAFLIGGTFGDRPAVGLGWTFGPDFTRTLKNCPSGGTPVAFQCGKFGDWRLDARD